MVEASDTLKLTGKRVMVRAALAALDANATFEVEVAANEPDCSVLVRVLEACGAVPVRGFQVFGNLNLHGQLVPSRGILARVRPGKAIVPAGCGSEVEHLEGVEAYEVANVRQLVEFLNDREAIPRVSALPWESIQPVGFETSLGTLEGIGRLQEAVREGKPILFVGVPGSGKAMVARRLASLMEPFTFEQALETSKICSEAGIWSRVGTARPFRAPHHTGSARGLLQELQLATNGVLFLDELEEFRRSLLDEFWAAYAAMGGKPLVVGAVSRCACTWSICECSNGERERHAGRVAKLRERFATVFEVHIVRAGKRCCARGAVMRFRRRDAQDLESPGFGGGGRAEHGRSKYQNPSGLTVRSRSDGRVVRGM